MFAIVSVGFNCHRFLDEWYQSIITQERSDWRCYVITDPSNDGTMERLQEIDDPRFTLKVNRERKFCLRNTVEAVSYIEDSNDIVVCLDLDDRFYHKRVLDRLAEEYSDPKTWLTYGTYTTSDGQPGNHCREIEDHIWQTNSHRKAPWAASALRTFKTWLFRKIDQRDFLMPDGSWIRRATDRAFMYPMLEMSGKDHVKYIKEILYFYNIYGQQREQNDHEMDALKYIISKEPYRLVEETE